MANLIHSLNLQKSLAPNDSITSSAIERWRTARMLLTELGSEKKESGKQLKVLANASGQ